MPTWEVMKRTGQTAFISQGSSLHDEQMFDILFSFIDPIVDPMEEGWSYFITKGDALFDSQEQFIVEYERRGTARLLTPGEERLKNLDLSIGLSLLGQQGREQMYERLRLIRESRYSSGILRRKNATRETNSE